MAASTQVKIVGGPDLDGWKAIAEFLGVHPETAKDWGRRFGMPTRKWGPKKVVAYSTELRAWVERRRSAA